MSDCCCCCGYCCGYVPARVTCTPSLSTSAQPQALALLSCLFLCICPTHQTMHTQTFNNWQAPAPAHLSSPPPPTPPPRISRCWQETGLDGNFAQDFVATWESRSKPVAKTWAAVQDQWLNSIANFEGKKEACVGCRPYSGPLLLVFIMAASVLNHWQQANYTDCCQKPNLK